MLAKSCKSWQRARHTRKTKTENENNSFFAASPRLAVPSPLAAPGRQTEASWLSGCQTGVVQGGGGGGSRAEEEEETQAYENGTHVVCVATWSWS